MWQPIETAPKDGSKFDVWCINPDTGRGGARFTDVEMRGDGSGFGYVVFLGKDCVWQYLDARDYGAGYPSWLPTHWKPLPEPPHA